MNPAIKLVATIIVAAILTTLAVLLGMIILGVTPGHAAPDYSSITTTRGHGGHGGHK